MIARTECHHQGKDNIINEVTDDMVFLLLYSWFLTADLHNSFKKESSIHFNYRKKITKILCNNELVSRLTDS